MNEVLTELAFRVEQRREGHHRKCAWHLFGMTEQALCHSGSVSNAEPYIITAGKRLRS